MTTVQDTIAPLVEVTRGDRVESLHLGTIVVSDAARGVIATAGNPENFAYFRSSGKPFQAIPIVESGAAESFGLTPAELALCCASHYAEPSHQSQVVALLAKLGLSPDDLKCGMAYPMDEDEASRIRLGITQQSPLQCDCSGKHAGMLAVCQQLHYPIDSYLEPNHPLQIEIRRIMAEVLRTPDGELELGVDGCSVPTFGSSIASFAMAYAAFADPMAAGSRHTEALNRLRTAMTTHPENVSGTGSFVTELMTVSQGRIVAKSGAEGLICLGIPEASMGIAIRVADGSFRSHPEIVLSTLQQLDTLDRGLTDAIETICASELHNHNGWIVGAQRAVFSLTSVA
ncbi:asparaginase [soil metagenome]